MSGRRITIVKGLTVNGTSVFALVLNENCVTPRTVCRSRTFIGYVLDNNAGSESSLLLAHELADRFNEAESENEKARREHSAGEGK